nr:aldehyde dehydrogenase family protein [Acidobacteriota bacterium]
MTAIPFKGMHVNGETGNARGDGVMDIINPANGKVFVQVPRGTEEDIDRAVRAADKAYSGAWGRMNSRDRGRALYRLAELINEHAEELGAIESRNVGKPIRAAVGEMGAVANCFNYYAGAVNKIHGQTIPGAADGQLMTFRESLGVCGLIVPWNFPLIITAWKLAPCLAMGNTAVIKPAETTPLTALRLAELVLEAGIPPGVVNVVPGDGPAAGAALVRHPLVRKVSFTGSSRTGTQIMRLASADMTRISLELGGKSANIVFADTDVDACVSSSLWSVFDNTGQDCCARSRMLVQRPIFEEFVEKFVEAAREIRVGDPTVEGTQMGPLISAAHREKVCGYLQQGTKEGARRLCGGQKPGADLADGFYLTPAVFIDVDNEMRFMQEEIFGPVVGLMPFDD